MNPIQTSESATTRVEIAPIDRFPLERGVAALVSGHPIALFRLGPDEVVAIDHVDPFTGVPVLARGIVGSAGDVPIVASPLHKQRFELRTGRCLDDEERSVRCWPVDVVDGMVHVLGPKSVLDLTHSER